VSDLHNDEGSEWFVRGLARNVETANRTVENEAKFACKPENLTAICEPIVWTVLDPLHFTTTSY
jgi:hypothetical protein